MNFHPIGYAKTPFEEVDNVPLQSAGISSEIAELVIHEEYVQGLDDLDGFSHIYVLFHIHKAKGVALKVKPFLDTQDRGIFATRSPTRPNPIGLSIVEIDHIEGQRIFVKGIDLLNDTPIIDIKPYIQSFDNIKGTKDGWYEQGLDPKQTRSDNRFAQ